MKNIETFEPDIADLQSWLCTATDPALAAVWDATKYLSAPYKVWLAAWKLAGKPDISENANEQNQRA